MTRYFLRAIGSGIFIVWGAMTLVFLIIRLAPGDQAALLLGPDATSAEVKSLRESLGLDRPIFIQYGIYLAHAVHLDFGQSYRFGTPSMELVLQRLPATIDLTVAAGLLALVGIALGAIAGWYRGRAVDRGISTAALALQSVPTFWVGIVLILVFALKLQLLPSSGVGTPAHIIMPAVTLATPFIAIVIRITRSSVAEQTEEDYALTARSKGLRGRQVLFGHVLRNASIPVVTIVTLQFSSLLGGAVIVENIFAWPGLGSLLVSSIANRDYAVVQAAALVIALIVVVLNVLADTIYAQLDPRIRLGADR